MDFNGPGYGSEEGAAAPEGDPVLEKLNGFDRKLKGWAAFRRDFREARAMTAGDQWPQEAIDALLEEDETASPAVFNFVDPMVSAISGAEITNRQKVQYAPREAGDVKANELLTGAAEWARDECDAGDEESQAFRDALVGGLGVTETRMDYDEDVQGQMRVDRVDAVGDKIEIDPSARKTNYVDAKFMKRTRRYDKSEARMLFPALCGDTYGGAGAGGEDLSPHRNDPEDRYDADAADKQNADAPLGENEIEINEYQWKELERVTLVVDPATRQVLTLSQAQVEKLAAGGVNVQTMTQSASVRRTRYRRAFRCGARHQTNDLPDGEFTYKFITGKIDDKTGRPYGVVRAMIDPQRWSNKFLLQMDRIFAANAKGGIWAEDDAVDDWDGFNESYAKRDKVTRVAEGALSNGKIGPKPTPPFPVIADRLLTIATNAVSQVTGVNKEMLGMAERDQAGVLEYQRKQAAYGVLAQFFDSLKRYRKLQGRLTLKYIRKYMSDGRLVRITGDNGVAQYVPLIRDPETQRYDVIVDEAPAGPNQVERTWATFVQGAPLIKTMFDMGLPPQMIFTILEYSPFPPSFVDKMREHYMAALQQQQQPNQLQQLQQQLAIALEQAKVGKMQGEAALAGARAAKEGAEAQSAPINAFSEAELKRAQAQAAQIETMLRPHQAASEAELSRARAQRERTEAELEPQRLVLDARDQMMNYAQAQMAHRANAMRFDGPGFGVGLR